MKTNSLSCQGVNLIEEKYKMLMGKMQEFIKRPTNKWRIISWSYLGEHK